MKYIFTNRFLILGFAVVIGALSLFADLVLGSGEWFQRSGSIITIMGAILSTRKIIQNGISATIQSEYTISGGDFTTDWAEIKLESERNVKSAIVGVYLLIIGTSIWGYGDLFYCFLSQH